MIQSYNLDQNLDETPFHFTFNLASPLFAQSEKPKAIITDTSSLGEIRVKIHKK